MNWARTNLGEFAPFSYGKSLPKEQRIPGAVPVYGSNGVVGSHNAAFVDGPSVIIGRKGSVGEVHLSEIPSWPIDTAFFAQGSDKADLNFLYYLLKTLPITSNSDSAVPGLNRDFAHSLEFQVPPLATQNAIGLALRVLDKRIKANIALSKTLEDIAQTILKSWFVDYEPVKAKMAGKNPLGMDHNISSLFPDSMEDSELGPIPLGWEVRSVSEFGRVVTGKTPSTSNPQYWGDEIPFVTIPDLHGQLIATSTRRALTQLGADSQQSQSIPRGSTMVSCIATPGLVSYASTHCQTNQQINSVIPSNEYSPAWLYWHMRSLIPKLIRDSGIGTVFANLNKNDFSNIKSITPPKPLRDAYSELATPILDMMENLSRQSQSLAEVRDALLPRLISGELKFPEEMLA